MGIRPHFTHKAHDSLVLAKKKKSRITPALLCSHERVLCQYHIHRVKTFFAIFNVEIHDIVFGDFTF